MIAERVLDDVGRNSCIVLRRFLSVSVLQLRLALSIFASRVVATRPTKAVITIMRNLVVQVSMMNDAIYSVYSDWSVRQSHL